MLMTMLKSSVLLNLLNDFSTVLQEALITVKLDFKVIFIWNEDYLA